MDKVKSASADETKVKDDPVADVEKQTAELKAKKAEAARQEEEAQLAGTVSVDPAAAKRAAEHNEAVDREMAQRNEVNEQAQSEQPEELAPQPGPAPTMMKSRDAIRNTPIIDPKTGEKTWHS